MSTEHKGHILPVKLYLTIALALFILTAVTVAMANIHLGPWNAVVALMIALTKASLVALFFMHLKFDHKLNMFVFLAAISFVALFITITMFDTLRRGDIYEIRAHPIQKDAVIYQQEKQAPPAH